jgi:glycosyltransferase involved in cell wall biosynthesis
MRIAIVSYHFTPSTMVAALRARGLAKYLGRAGHSVTVLTAEPEPERSPGWEVVTVPGRTPSSRIRQALGVSQHHTVVNALSETGPRRALHLPLVAARRTVQEAVFWPDEAAGWSKRVRRRLDELIASDAVDVVISTSPPASAHMAVLGADRRNVAWVADYRDLWTLAHHYPLSPLRRALDRRWDARVFREADAVTVATNGFAETARAAFPQARLSVVYNGFDPETFELPPRTSPNTKLTLVHAGSLYGGRVDPEVLFAAIERLRHDGRVPRDGLHVDFFSAAEAWLTRSVAEHGLEDIVTVHGTRPREEVIRAYASADVLVLLQWDTPGERAVMPAKTFEYLAAGRFVLAVGSPRGGEVDRLLAQTRAGSVVNDVAETADAVARLYDEFRGTGLVKVPSDEAAVARWTQMAMADAMLRAIETARDVRRGSS